MNLENKKFIIASGPVIIENNKVLLNRGGEKDKNIWKFVGGKVDDVDLENINNSLEDACKREVKEEMGIDVEILRPIKPMLMPHISQKDTMVILIHYLAKRIGEIKPGEDIEEFKWFDIDNLPGHCAPNIGIVIEEYKKNI